MISLKRTFGNIEGCHLIGFGWKKIIPMITIIIIWGRSAFAMDGSQTSAKFEGSIAD